MMKAKFSIATLGLLSMLTAASAFATGADAEAVNPQNLKRVNMACNFQEWNSGIVAPQHERFENCSAYASLVVRHSGMGLENDYHRLAILCTQRLNQFPELIYSDGAVVSKFRKGKDYFLKVQAPQASTPKILVEFDHDLRKIDPTSSGRSFRAYLEVNRQTLPGECQFERERHSPELN